MDAATLMVLLMNGELLTSDKQPLASEEASYNSPATTLRVSCASCLVASHNKLYALPSGRYRIRAC
jgi:hypothetical protein